MLGKGCSPSAQGLTALPEQAGPVTAASISPAPQHIPGEGEQGLRAPELKCSPVAEGGRCGESPDGARQGN